MRLSFKNILPLLLAATIFMSASPSFAARKKAVKAPTGYDVAIVGGGSGGCAAAIQAARMGMKVIILEPTDCIGGQMTASAVCTMDDKTLTRTGIYKEFIDNVCYYYSSKNKTFNTCYWGSNTIAFEPKVGRDVLLKLLENAGSIEIVYKATPVSAKVEKNTVKSASFSVDGQEKPLNVDAKIFIDASECGDFLPLTSAKVRTGNDTEDNLDPNSIIQDITYVAVVRKYPFMVPDELVIKEKPPSYDKYIAEFRNIVRKDGNVWPGSYPYNVASHIEYRGLPDSASNINIDGGDPRSWPLVSKTCLNWANDYPGDTYGNKTKHLGVFYLTDKNVRLEANRAAMEKTLCFIYYMQAELGMFNWSVDNSADYSGYSIAKWQDVSELAQKYGAILKHFPPAPYVRESRRVVGEKTMTIPDVLRDGKLMRTRFILEDSIALGEYPTDLHGASDTRYLDRGLAERKQDVPNDWEGNGGIFQIPVGVLIPEKIDGLLAAEKNISVSRVVNGSTRLQPVTMLTGQAAGALAAISVKQGKAPRKVDVFEVQRALLDSRDRLSPYRLKDINEANTKYWTAVEIALLCGYMKPASEDTFGFGTAAKGAEVKYAVEKFIGRKIDYRGSLAIPVFCRELADILSSELSEEMKKSCADIIAELKNDDFQEILREELAMVLYRLKIKMSEAEQTQM